MKSMEYIGQCINANKKFRKAMIFGATGAGVAAGAYIGGRKIMKLIEDKKLARYYENEFMEQENEENEELEKAVDEFNSRRLKRDEYPHCSENE